MMVYMKRILFLLILLCPASVSAYIAIVTDQSQPYETVPVEAPPGEERYFLGELTGYPIMYEVQADDPFSFVAQVRQLANTEQQPLSLIVVRKNDRGGGVREVARMNTSPDEWARARDAAVGLTFSQSPLINEPVEAGVYRIEVSSPRNTGKFMLQIGEQPTDAGYIDRLSAVRTTQTFFGRSMISMLGSSLIFYPVGILLLLFLIYKTWQYRHVFRGPQNHVST